MDVEEVENYSSQTELSHANDLNTDVETSVPLGCKHYIRKCLFVSPCCGKIFPCRICHDKVSTHEIDRHAIIEIVCSNCNSRQAVSNKCINCDVEFGKYFCSVCRLYDGSETEKYHCSGCGICRLGKRENYFHCDKCGYCLPTSLISGHRCIENASKTDCPVCMTDLHSSRNSCHIPKCGHLLHTKCYNMLLRTGHYKCPICSVSTVSMEQYWKRIDDEIANTQMPEEYANLKKWILCHDCHSVSHVIFHVLGMKCSNCGSYNTSDTNPPNQDGTPV